jgi:hypothetical protein
LITSASLAELVALRMLLQVAAQDIGQLPYMQQRRLIPCQVSGDRAISHVSGPVRQADKFYQRVCARLGEGTYRAPADDDPLIAWAQHHRSSSTSDREEARVGERR